MMQTLVIIFEQVFLCLPLALGAFVSFSLMKVPDLSIESAYVFGAILASKTLSQVHGVGFGLNVVFVICASIIGGMLVGTISSVLTKVAKLPHLLSSILTIGLFHGVNQYVLGMSNMSISQFSNPLMIKDFFPQCPELPMLVAVGVIIAILGYFFLKTQLGYCLAVYGNNPEFFQYHRISTKFVFISGLVMSNALAGLSGYFVAQSSGFVDVNAGMGTALFCITFLILGKTLRKKQRSFLIPILGLILYFCLQQLLLRVGFNLKYFTMIQSVIVILILINKYRNKSMYDVKDNLGV